MPNFLFSHSFEIEKKILKSNFIYLFLDYDGTLVNFQNRPTEVKTPIKIIKIIKQLIKNPNIMIIIVTGRSLHDIKKLLNINGLSFIALHGLIMETSNGLSFTWKKENQARLLIRGIKEDIQEEVKKEKGAFLEDKDLTIVLHYRLSSKNRIQVIREKFKKVVKSKDKKKIFEIINGEKIIEARPRGWNKGKAIEMLLNKHINKKNILPIYIGDDVTDEDAFQVLENIGITVYVANNSKRKTIAQYWVKNPDEVYFFLQSISKLLHKV